MWEARKKAPNKYRAPQRKPRFGCARHNLEAPVEMLLQITLITWKKKSKFIISTPRASFHLHMQLLMDTATTNWYDGEIVSQPARKINDSTSGMYQLSKFNTQAIVEKKNSTEAEVSSRINSSVPVLDIPIHSSSRQFQQNYTHHLPRKPLARYCSYCRI